MKTATRIDAPTVLLIGLDDHVGGICFAYFDDGGMRIVAVRNVAGATTRLPQVMPTIVVAPAELPPAEVAVLEEHASAVGAEMVAIEKGATEPSVKQRLAAALVRAGRRRGAANNA